MLSRASALEGSHDTDRIEKAGQEFESLLLGHWLEEAQESFGSAPGGGDDDEDESTRAQFQAIGMQSLATAIAKAGGIGLAKLISRELERQDAFGATRLSRAKAGS